MLLLKDLDELNDIFNELVPVIKQECKTELNDKELEEFQESIQIIIKDFINNNYLMYKLDKFNDLVFENIVNLVYKHFVDIVDLFKHEEIENIIRDNIIFYFEFEGIPRSYPNTFGNNNIDVDSITMQINHLRNIPQPEQRTDEWYQFRWERITASSAWKILDTEASRNQFIYGKCVPIDKSKYSNVNINSATHHGQKYEEVSVMFYENKYGTKIEEFGCIPSSNYEFIGASPDGINVEPTSNRYGRLLEIKNPTTRKISGVPKKAYWIQMQMQMYVTGLHECDFLETSFKEYESEEEFLNDGTFNYTADNKLKGIVVCMSNGEKPVYLYPPINISQEEFDDWYDKELDKNQHLTWINNSYWKLNKISCILVPFNKRWFESIIPEFKNIWDIILKERKTGFNHRKPKRRRKNSVDKNDKTTVVKIDTQAFTSNL